MALTPQEAFGQLEIGLARMMALVINLKDSDGATEVELDAVAEQMSEIADSLIAAWASLVLDGRAIDAMRDALAPLGKPVRSAE
jgi:hypothetical protein